MSEVLDALLARLELEPPEPDDPFDDVGLHVDDDKVGVGVGYAERLTGSDEEIDAIGRLLFRCSFFIYGGGLERALPNRPADTRDVVVELFLLRQELPDATRSVLEEFTTFFAQRGVTLNVVLITRDGLRPPS